MGGEVNEGLEMFDAMKIIWSKRDQCISGLSLDIGGYSKLIYPSSVRTEVLCHLSHY